ncbi:MAG TPA: methionyl-tRNA formyltransferase, partial [Hyphomicrobiaceae bacterium]|nr:methionyl-tRNA formyltransferase [Hyphomicrobiaceae bacterium]
GLTIFWPNEGLDEGPILIQKTTEIGPDESLGDVYFKKLFPMGVDAMIEGLELVRAGVKLRHPQNLADGSYESWFKKDLAELDWSKPVADVYNVIRAANPAPGAWGTIKGQKVDIFDSAKVAATGKPGEIVAIDGNGVTIAAGGGAILAKRVRGADGKKIPAGEFVKAAGLKVGDVFDKPAPKPQA